MSHDEIVTGSLTRLLPRIKQGDNDAYNKLAVRILSRVVGIANRAFKRKYPGLPRTGADEEDAAQDVLVSLWRGAQRGMFEQLANRNDLWNLLATITARKIAKKFRASATRKRGGRMMRRCDISQIDTHLDSIAAPDLAVEFRDTYDAMIACLTKEQQRVALDWAEGRPRLETARDLKVTMTTVSRMRRQIAETVRTRLSMEE